MGSKTEILLSFDNVSIRLLHIITIFRSLIFITSTIKAFKYKSKCLYDTIECGIVLRYKNGMYWHSNSFSYWGQLNGWSDGMKLTSVEYQGCFGLIDCKKELRPYCLSIRFQGVVIKGYYMIGCMSKMNIMDMISLGAIWPKRRRILYSILYAIDPLYKYADCTFPSLSVFEISNVRKMTHWHILWDLSIVRFSFIRNRI